jgi:hypothetical protein
MLYTVSYKWFSIWYKIKEMKATIIPNSVTKQMDYD